MFYFRYFVINILNVIKCTYLLALINTFFSLAMYYETRYVYTIYLYLSLTDWWPLCCVCCALMHKRGRWLKPMMASLYCSGTHNCRFFFAATLPLRFTNLKCLPCHCSTAQVHTRVVSSLPLLYCSGTHTCSFILAIALLLRYTYLLFLPCSYSAAEVHKLEVSSLSLLYCSGTHTCSFILAIALLLRYTRVVSSLPLLYCSGIHICCFFLAPTLLLRFTNLKSLPCHCSTAQVHIGTLCGFPFSLLHNDNVKLLWNIVWCLVQLSSDQEASNDTRQMGGIPLLLSLLQ